MGAGANSARAADLLDALYGGRYDLIVMALEVIESDSDHYEAFVE